MRCVSCGMAITRKPIREELGGRVYHYCCLDCLREGLCQRDRTLDKPSGLAPAEGDVAPRGAEAGGGGRATQDRRTR